MIALAVRLLCWLQRHEWWGEWTDPKKQLRRRGHPQLYERSRTCRCGRRVHAQTLTLTAVAPAPASETRAG